jgi:hypothetical protein
MNFIHRELAHNPDYLAASSGMFSYVCQPLSIIFSLDTTELKNSRITGLTEIT